MRFGNSLRPHIVPGAETKQIFPLQIKPKRKAAKNSNAKNTPTDVKAPGIAYHQALIDLRA